MRLNYNRLSRVRWAAGSLMAFALTAGIVAQVLAAVGPIGTAAGFEDNDGNLTPQAPINFDWNSFAPLTWTGTAPNQTSSKVVNGWTFLGLTDASKSTTDSGFGGGTKEDQNCPAVIGSSAPNKDDLEQAYLATKSVGGHIYLMLAWVRIPQNTTSPSAHIAFEFNQGKVLCGAGSDSLVNRVAGDLLILYDFTGGSTVAPTIGVQHWIISGTCGVKSDSPPCWGPETTPLPSKDAEAAVNTGVGDFSGVTPDCLSPSATGGVFCTTTGESLGLNQFGEAGIDLSAPDIGIFPPGTCATFGQANAISRSSGDSGTAALEDLVGPGPFQISNCPAIVTQTSAGPVTVGQTITDKATLSGGVTPTGTISFNVYGPGDTTCSTPLSPAPASATVNGDGDYTSGPFTTTAAGTYLWIATYSGDANNPPVSTKCGDANESSVVGKATTQTATVVVNDGTSTSTGASFHDTATVSGVNGIVPTGTVTYNFFTNGTCTAPAVSNTTFPQTVTLSSGTVPPSASTGPLAAGSYSFQATYNGDTNYVGSTSACEPFSVTKATTQAATQVENQATNAPPIGTEVTGASFFDTATVSGQQASFVPTGTVTYNFFTNGSCTAPAVANGTFPQTVTLTSTGAVPQSNFTGPLAAGSYSFQAIYSGDTNYNGSISACEPFSLAKASTQTATSVVNESGGTSVGASFHDTATVTGQQANIVPTGTVTYSFFTNGGCTAPPASTQTVTLNANGTVPDSASTGPLAAGDYSFQATYSGDPNYLGSTSACEPFSVGTTASSTSTQVENAATNAPPSGTEATGASFYDTATVTGQVGGFVPTGTVTYSFFTNGGCIGTPSSTQMVTLSSTGMVPNSNATGPLTAGNYSFQATYSGDTNYQASTSGCEPFLVNTASTNLQKDVAITSVTIQYSYKETNTGAVTLTNAHVVDTNCTTLGGTITPASVTLGPNQSQVFTCTVTLSGSQLNGTTLTNIAIGHGTDPDGNDVTVTLDPLTNQPNCTNGTFANGVVCSTDETASGTVTPSSTSVTTSANKPY
jgi:Bacterial Ig-like domain (group 3)